MPANISPRVARELNVQLVACYTEGVNDGIMQVFTNTADGAAMPNVLECVRFAPSGTAENVYTFAPSDYTLSDDTAGDEAPFEGVKMYEQRISSGRFKKKEIIVDLADYMDDKVGQFGVLFHVLGTTTVVAPYRRVTAVMAGAGSIISTIDDVAFFSQAHPQRPKEIGGTPWSNDLIQPQGLTLANFGTAWAAMCSFPGEDGKPVGSRPSHLCIEPADFGNAMDICFSDRPSGLGGGGNPWKGLVIPVVVPEWAGLGIYQLLDCHSSIERPFVYQEREALKLRPIYTNPEDQWVRDNGKMKWNIQGRYNVGIGHPRRALRSRKS